MATNTDLTSRRNIQGTQTAARFSRYSRYLRNSTIYRDTNTDNLKIDYQRPAISSNDSDTIVEIKPEEAWRPDLIAERVYNGKQELGWVLHIYNSMFHVRDFQAGVLIRVPALNRLQGTIL